MSDDGMLVELKRLMAERNDLQTQVFLLEQANAGLRRDLVASRPATGYVSVGEFSNEMMAILGRALAEEREACARLAEAAGAAGIARAIRGRAV